MALLATLRSLSRPAVRFPTPHTHRPISTHAPPARRHYEYPKPAPDPTRGDRRPTDRQIPFDLVYVLDPSTNKLSSAKHRLSALLAAQIPTETRARRIVELVASAPEPVVRLTTRAEIEARYREMRRAAKRGTRVGAEGKAVQLAWGVGRADLEHKLRKAQRDLDKGHRVVVGVAVKRGHRPTRQEMVAFADEIAGALAGVGEECKEREVTERAMTLSFRRKVELEDVS